MHFGSASFWMKVLSGFFEATAPNGNSALYIARQLLKPWAIIHPYGEKRNPRLSGTNAWVLAY
jgi:hypothetical protein